MVQVASQGEVNDGLCANVRLQIEVEARARSPRKRARLAQEDDDRILAEAIEKSMTKSCKVI